ncbi:cytochrome c oxidase assembly protein COX19 [Leptidea sinapis]|uniref:Cytochrome c oxidase assembly protein COX19 n=1 Tax=Leptidea sinapis TaxID=189913 RepID=A0A5E4PNK9_9NEOP|nr:cytochrome c oxidase assembly protein COX19 [Leptidea sinapis]VVC86647.1 unnamed protein product [Leptidea sinapis]
MSTAMTFGQKQFIPTPPDKGSFPLDHEGICKKSMTRYLNCLFNNNSNASLCRDETKEYLECRMNNNLMAKEEWSRLGFPEEDTVDQSKK